MEDQTLSGRAGKLLAGILASASQPEPDDSLLLVIDGYPCGRLLPERMEFLQSLPERFSRHFAFSSSCVTLTPPGGDPARREFFAELAEWAHRSGALKFWRNELLDIRDLSGKQVLGQTERTFFRFLGLTTYCVHAAALCRDGRIHLARRSRKKRVSPGLWDTLSGGMVAAGESWEQALRRETYEEAGLKPGEYDFAGEPRAVTVLRPVPEGWMREVSVTWPVLVHESARPHNRDGEVEAFDLVGAQQVLERIEKGQVTIEASIALLTVLSDPQFGLLNLETKQ